jgi:hypothetical protein
VIAPRRITNLAAFSRAIEVTAPSRAPSRLGPVATLLLQEAWRLRLKLSGFEDIEDQADPDGPLADRGVPGHRNINGEGSEPGVVPAAQAEYYRQIGVASHSFKTRLKHRNRRVIAGGFGVFPISSALDRKILRMRADGATYEEIRATLKIGDYRYYRVLRQADERIRREMKMGNKDKPDPQRQATGQLEALNQANLSAQQQAQATQVLTPPPAPAVPAMATRALTDPTGLAREYATAAAEILTSKPLMPQSRTNAVRLLRLSIEMLAG